MAINYLVMTGKLSFDDDIALYLKDFHSGDKKIWVRNLLTHTSGIIDLHKISNYFPGELGKKYSPEDLMGVFNGHSLEFDPGQGYSYSNSGYILLAQIIEKITGEKYETFINQNLLLPLNMCNTKFSENDPLQPDLPLGYDMEDDKVTMAKYLHPSHLIRGGAIKTNLDDIIKWYSFLKNLREDHEQNFIEITTPFTLGNGNSSNSSSGWFNGEIKGHKILFHGGGVYGFNSHILFIPEEDIFIVIMKNCIDKYRTPGIEMTANYIAAIFVQGAKSYMTFEFSENGNVESIVLHQGGIYKLTGKKE